MHSDDLSIGQIEEIFGMSDRLKHRKGNSLKNNEILALLFEKSSTRTRLSFESAMIQLGGHPVYIDSKTSQMSRGESLGDTARVLSGYVDIIAARMYRQEDLEELARYADVPVINALTDMEHPCQALSDVYTVREVFGKVKGLRIAFIGDIRANTANSLMVTASKLGARITLVGPEGYEPDKKYVSIARKYSDVDVSSSIEKGLKGCDVVYTDTFVSMGQEEEAERRRKMFSAYRLSSSVLRHANKGAKVMHCLPAHRGEEITSDVIDGKSSIVWQQARNKMTVEKAILLYLLNAKR